MTLRADSTHHHQIKRYKQPTWKILWKFVHFNHRFLVDGCRSLSGSNWKMFPRHFSRELLAFTTPVSSYFREVNVERIIAWPSDYVNDKLIAASFNDTSFSAGTSQITTCCSIDQERSLNHSRLDIRECIVHRTLDTEGHYRRHSSGWCAGSEKLELKSEPTTVHIPAPSLGRTEISLSRLNV